MSKFVDEEELEGLTIKKCITDDEILLLFTNGSYTKIKYEAGYYSGDGDVKFTEPSEFDLVRLGVLDGTEFERRRRQEEEERQKRLQREKVALYERLKRELGKVNTYTAEVVPVVLEKHENADKLSVVRVKGWQVCTETTQWKEGQLGCYITPDTLVPISNPLFSFLVKDAKDFGTADLPKMMTRIKARRLRGVVSYGLLVPAPPGFKEGDDLFNVLGLEHYDPETTRTVKEKSSNRIKLGGETESPPNLPILPPYYDIENIQNRPNWFQEEEEVLLTEKIDGSNMIVVWWEGRFWVKSRKEWKREYPSYAHLTEEKLTEQGCAPEKAKQIMERLRDRPKEQSEFWKAFRRVEDVVGKYCKDNPGHCVVGEMYGSNGKIRYCSPCTFRAFDIMRWDEWVDPFEAREVLGEDLMWAPLVAKMPYNLEKILSLSEGMSLVNPEVIREGVVVNPLKERRTNRGERIKLKAVSPVYLERF